MAKNVRSEPLEIRRGRVRDPPLPPRLRRRTARRTSARAATARGGGRSCERVSTDRPACLRTRSPCTTRRVRVCV